MRNRLTQSESNREIEPEKKRGQIAFATCAQKNKQIKKGGTDTADYLHMPTKSRSLHIIFAFLPVLFSSFFNADYILSIFAMNNHLFSSHFAAS